MSELLADFESVTEVFCEEDTLQGIGGISTHTSAAVVSAVYEEITEDPLYVTLYPKPTGK